MVSGLFLRDNTGPMVTYQVVVLEIDVQVTAPPVLASHLGNEDSPTIDVEL